MKYNHAERATCESRHFSPQTCEVQNLQENHETSKKPSLCAEKLTDKNVLGLMV